KPKKRNSAGSRWRYRPEGAKDGWLPRAERQQHFFPQRIFELFEVERRFTLIAQHLEHRRTAFFGHFDARVFQVHDMHLERLHEKILAVATTGTRQGQLRLLSAWDCTRWIPEKATKTSGVKNRRKTVIKCPPWQKRSRPRTARSRSAASPTVPIGWPGWREPPTAGPNNRCCSSPRRKPKPKPAPDSGPNAAKKGAGLLFREDI